MRRLAVVRGSLLRLESRRGLTLDEFLQDVDSQDVVLRHLQLAVQACLDCASHVLTESGWELPGNTLSVLMRK